MRLALRSKPASLADRAQAAGEDAIEFAKSVPERVQSGGKQAIAVAGAATGVVAGLAFWRRAKNGTEPIQPAPSRPVAPPPPVETPRTKKPVTSTSKAAAGAAGTRSK